MTKVIKALNFRIKVEMSRRSIKLVFYGNTE